MKDLKVPALVRIVLVNGLPTTTPFHTQQHPDHGLLSLVDAAVA